VVAEGHSFGEVGPYEKIHGVVTFAVDPTDPHNQLVFDIDKVSTDNDGLFRFTADFIILKPVNLKQGNGTLFYEVNNKGDLFHLNWFNDSSDPLTVHGNDPTTLADFGNGFLQRQGYSIASVGWAADAAAGGGRLTAQIPIAKEKGQPLVEKVITEIADATGTTQSLGYSSVSTNPYLAEAELRVRSSDSPRPSGPEIPEGTVVSQRL
jgi:hypothetical protein